MIVNANLETIISNHDRLPVVLIMHVEFSLAREGFKLKSYRIDRVFYSRADMYVSFHESEWSFLIPIVRPKHAVRSVIENDT